LRLNVLSFTSNGNETGEQMVAGLIAGSGYHPLHDGLAIKQYVNSGNEEGEQLHLHRWEVAIPVEGCSARLAMFTYTILASQSNDQQIQEEIELLGRCIRDGKFCREKGHIRRLRPRVTAKPPSPETARSCGFSFNEFNDLMAKICGAEK